jgi:hypothetical protein
VKPDFFFSSLAICLYVPFRDAHGR